MKQKAARLVILLGVVSLFADMSYEGARSGTGQLLAALGASATAVGFAAGFGEFLAYGLRLVSGWIADRTGAYWMLTFLGYGVNLIAVPLLAFAQRWEAVAGLMALERLGKALRGPSRDTILSSAAAPGKAGWAFGLHEAIDTTGAIAGPLFVAAAAARYSLQEAFLWLTVPAALSILALAAARRAAPVLPRPRKQPPGAGAFGPEFRWALIAAGLMGAGIADYALIAFHMKREGLLPAASIAAAYAGAQACAAISAFTLGRAFDRYGPRLLAAGAVLGALATLLALRHTAVAAVAGACCWGLATGIHGSVLKATISACGPPDRKAWAFGVFHSVYGVLCFLGSLAVGRLYDAAILLAIGFSMAAQLAALPFIARLRREQSPRPAAP
jgi:MFS family permease